ncbi:MAG: cupin domain-containing protein, partial [Rhodospirillales bacterium]|nr:cupin domain-containing protein [Acetobacter sp.]
MDPLSEVLALIKPQGLISGGYLVDGDVSIRFSHHPGIKCYAMITGECWIMVDGVPDPVRLTAGDCYLLPRGLPFLMTTDLSLPPMDFQDVRAQGKFLKRPPPEDGSGCYLAG